jgi:hypothetical protein
MKAPGVWLAGLCIIASACGDDGGGAADAGSLDAASIDAALADAATDAMADATPEPDANIFPVRLRDTGLYSDFDGRVIADDVQEFVPAYPLWSDGAVKRRWVHFPAGSTIDTSDMDFWVYPEGTKMWKQFESGGVLLETRFMWKAGPTPADWFYVAYAWNQDQTEALEVPGGALDVLGTTFDIPEQRDCRKCHQRQPDFSLGFSAIQLAHNGAGVTLDTLITDARLTVNPTGISPYYPVPGTGAEQEAIGYMHGNCGGCHHKSSDVMDTTNLNLRLEVASLATVEGTTTYSTTVNVDALLNLANVTKLIEPGDPDASAVYVRMNVRGSTAQMPPRGTEVIDTDAVANMAAWINSLPVP